MNVKVYVTNLDPATFEKTLKLTEKKLSRFTASLSYCAKQYSVTSAPDYFLNFPYW